MAPGGRAESSPRSRATARKEIAGVVDREGMRLKGPAASSASSSRGIRSNRPASRAAPAPRLGHVPKPARRPRTPEVGESHKPALAEAGHRRCAQRGLCPGKWMARSCGGREDAVLGERGEIPPRRHAVASHPAPSAWRTGARARPGRDPCAGALCLLAAWPGCARRASPVGELSARYIRPARLFAVKAPVSGRLAEDFLDPDPAQREGRAAGPVGDLGDEAKALKLGQRLGARPPAPLLGQRARRRGS